MNNVFALCRVLLSCCCVFLWGRIVFLACVECSCALLCSPVEMYYVIFVCNNIELKLDQMVILHSVRTNKMPHGW